MNSTRPVAPPPANVAKADPDPVAVEFLDTALPMHVQAFLAEMSPKAPVSAPQR